MKTLRMYCSIIFITIFSINAKIIETNNFEIISQYADKDTLVLFDIDNTLARPESELGSDEWFCYMIDQKIAHGYDKSSAMTAVLPLSYYALFNVPLVVTDLIVPVLLKNLTTRGIYTMGLTSRGPFLAERTYDQLINIDINFMMPPSATETALQLENPLLYKYAILFVGNNDKGDALLLFLDTIGYHPSSIIFIDDKMSHVQSVEKAAISRNINYIGIRYSGCDTYINHFDPAKADMQLHQLQQKNRKPAQQYKNSTPTNALSCWYYYLLLFLIASLVFVLLSQFFFKPHRKHRK